MENKRKLIKSLSANQCPQCRKHLDKHDRFVLCGDCTAKHHEKCWSDQGHCNACQSTKLYVRSQGVSVTKGTRRYKARTAAEQRRSQYKGLLSFVAALLALLSVGLFLLLLITP